MREMLIYEILFIVFAKHIFDQCASLSSQLDANDLKLHTVLY